MGGFNAIQVARAFLEIPLDPTPLRWTSYRVSDKGSSIMAGSPFHFRNMALVLAAGGFLAAAAVQACSPGTLEDSGAYKAQVDMYAPSTGSGGGVSVGTGGGGSVATGGKPGVGTGGVGTGGGASVKSDADFYPAGCDMPKHLATCTLSACHQGPVVAIGKPFDMKTAPLWSRFLDKPASLEDGVGGKIPGCQATPALLINSTTPAESWILKKVNGTQDASCGGQMPDGGLKDATAKKCIQDWIMNIATNGKL